jgi:hypothetical protein
VTTTPTAPRPASRLGAHGRRCACARCRAEAALTLLRAGRVDMATHLMATLPDRITEEIGWAFAAGHDGRSMARSPGPPKRKSPRAGAH